MKTASHLSNTKHATISSKETHRGKSRLCFSLMCGAIFGLLSTSSFAGITGSVTLNGNLGNYLSYNWTGTNGTSYSEYVSPYPATVTYNGEINAPAYLSCMDIYNPTPVGVTIPGVWNTDTASYSPALKQASWLVDQLYGLTPSTANPNVVGPISEAIWSIMLPSSTHPARGARAAHCCSAHLAVAGRRHTGVRCPRCRSHFDKATHTSGAARARTRS